MKNASLRKIIFAALMAALTTVATMIIRIPTPTQGYIHLGDGMVLLCGALLGPGLGALAAGIGSMLSDLFAGYMSYVPGTFVIKALTAMVGGWLYLRLSAGADRRAVPVRVVLSGIPAEAVMVIGYFLYEMGMEVAMGSNAAAAATAVAVGIPMNIVQGVAGIIVWRGTASGAEPAQGHRHREERLISIEPLPLFIFLSTRAKENHRRTLKMRSAVVFAFIVRCCLYSMRSSMPLYGGRMSGSSVFSSPSSVSPPNSMRSVCSSREGASPSGPS